MAEICITEIALRTLTHDFLRYALGAGGVYLVVNMALAKRLAGRKIRRDFPNRKQIRREVAASLRTVLIFALFGTIIVSAAMMGWISIYTDIDDYGWIWLLVSTVLIVTLHDAFFYWAHWIMHRPRLFRHLHRTHHRSHNPSPFAAYSFDVGEAVIMAIYLPIFVAIFPVHPAVIMIFTVHMILRNALGHSGVEIYPAGSGGKPMFDWMTTTTHHDLHHAHAGWNFGLYFTWWDRWMGTEHPDYHREFERVTQSKPAEQVF